MMSRDYVGAMECEDKSDPDSACFVGAFIKAVFVNIIKKNRNDLATEIKSNTSMRLE